MRFSRSYPRAPPTRPSAAGAWRRPIGMSCGRWRTGGQGCAGRQHQAALQLPLRGWSAHADLGRPRCLGRRLQDDRGLSFRGSELRQHRRRRLPARCAIRDPNSGRAHRATATARRHETHRPRHVESGRGRLRKHLSMASPIPRRGVTALQRVGRHLTFSGRPNGGIMRG